MSEMIREFGDADVTREALAKQGATLIDFWASWCGPCRMMAPVLAQLAPEYEGRLSFAKLNIDEHPDAAQAFGVASIPTLIVVKNGEEVARLVGARPRAALKAELDKLV